MRLFGWVRILILALALCNEAYATCTVSPSATVVPPVNSGLCVVRVDYVLGIFQVTAQDCTRTSCPDVTFNCVDAPPVTRGCRVCSGDCDGQDLSEYGCDEMTPTPTPLPSPTMVPTMEMPTPLPSPTMMPTMEMPTPLPSPTMEPTVTESTDPFRTLLNFFRTK